MTPRVVFLGTPDAAVPILQALAGAAEIALVVTRADASRGRSDRPIPPPVKVAARDLGLEVAQPTTAAELFAAVVTTEPSVAVVAAYGRLIKPDLLAALPHGFLNVHYSLLPRWRGASPVVRAILAGDTETGVSLMQMDEGLDTGPVLATKTVPIGPADTTGTLTATLAAAGASLLLETLPGFLAGEVVGIDQDHGRATAAAKVTTDEAHLDPLRHSARAIDLAVRAYAPAPGAWCRLDGDRFKVWAVAAAPEGAPQVAPGAVMMVDGDVVMGTRDGAVTLLEVQPAGRGRMTAAAWMNGRRGEPAELS